MPRTNSSRSNEVEKFSPGKVQSRNCSVIKTKSQVTRRRPCTSCTAQKTNMAIGKTNHLKMHLLWKKWWFSIAMLVFRWFSMVFYIRISGGFLLATHPNGRSRNRDLGWPNDLVTGPWDQQALERETMFMFGVQPERIIGPFRTLFFFFWLGKEHLFFLQKLMISFVKPRILSWSSFEGESMFPSCVVS